MKNFYLFNYNGAVLKDEHRPLTNTAHYWRMSIGQYNNYVTDELHQYFKSIKFISNNSVNLFSGSPNASSAIHIDTLQCAWAINYVWSAPGSEMIWYKSLLDYLPSNTPNPVTEKPAHWYQPDEVLEIERASLYKQLALVRIDVPHAGYNPTSEYRSCISFRGHPMRSWEHIVEYFSTHLIIGAPERI